MTSTMSVGGSHGSPLHGLALDLLFRINCLGSRSDRYILGGMGHLYRQAPRVRGYVPFPHVPSRCRVFPEHCGFAEHGNKRQRTRVNTRRRVGCLCRAAHGFIHGAPEGLNPLHQDFAEEVIGEMRGAPRDKWVCRTFPHRLAQDLKEELRDQIREGLIRTEQACLQWLEDEERVDAPNQKLEDFWSILLPLDGPKVAGLGVEPVCAEIPTEHQAG